MEYSTGISPLYRRAQRGAAQLCGHLTAAKWFLSGARDTVVIMEVEIVRSARRRKTIGARMVGDVLRVMVPDTLTAAEEQHWVEVMTAKVAHKQTSPRHDLSARAAYLAQRYDLLVPTSVEWSTRQKLRWGSCTPTTGRIRLSDRMRDYPQWVIDYVLVHELAHLSEHGHGPAFKALMARYPLAERGEGYLIAKAEDGRAGSPHPSHV